MKRGICIIVGMAAGGISGFVGLHLKCLLDNKISGSVAGAIVGGLTGLIIALITGFILKGKR